MNRTSDQHTGLGWWHVLPLLVIGALATVLWRPANDPAPTVEQEEKISDLARQLGSATASAGAIDDRLRSFGPFPPEAKASRALADAIVMCEIERLDESRRTQLARQLYGITVIGDSRAATVPAALIGIQQSLASAGCNPAVIDRLMRAARDVAGTDPHPRRDWW
jgi:hypothetical protein